MQHHLFIWFEDSANGGSGPARGLPESVFDQLDSGRVLERRYSEPGVLVGVEITFLSNEEGSVFSRAVQQLAVKHNTRAWVRGVDYLDQWRNGVTLFGGSAPVQVKRLFVESHQPHQQVIASLAHLNNTTNSTGDL